MSVTRYSTSIALVIGAVWAIAGFGGAVLTLFIGAIGYVIGQVLEGRVDLTEYLGHRQNQDR